jgi:hypothetical protein
MALSFSSWLWWKTLNFSLFSFFKAYFSSSSSAFRILSYYSFRRFYASLTFCSSKNLSVFSLRFSSSPFSFYNYACLFSSFSLAFFSADSCFAFSSSCSLAMLMSFFCFALSFSFTASTF